MQHFMDEACAIDEKEIRPCIAWIYYRSALARNAKPWYYNKLYQYAQNRALRRIDNTIHIKENAMYKNLSDKPIAEVQLAQADKWDEMNMLEKCVSQREGQPNFLFYEGPPTANGKPGIHHVIARTLKDSICRYKTMQGYKVRRKAGWDTHGLPVEIEVEKQLGFSGKQDIEKYGIKELNEKLKI